MAGPQLTDEVFEKFKNIVYDESGICFNSINRIVLEARINENLKRKGLETHEEYYSLLTKDKAEMQHFLDSVTTNLTKFFRNDAHFKSFREKVLPEIIARKGGTSKSLKIWSAGCSTGEEPYSIAIVLLDTPLLRGWDLKVYASDLSLKSLITAKAGKYRKDKLENVEPRYLSTYFEEVGAEYVVKDEVKKLIRFDYHNLRHKGSMSSLDIIFCRNVIIYFDAESQKQTISRFYDTLNTDGYLYIGHSESLFGMETNFRFNKVGNSILYTKGNINLD